MRGAAIVESSLRVEPSVFDTRTRYRPAVACDTAAIVYVELVEPKRAWLSLNHWYVNGPVPETSTDSVILPDTFGKRSGWLVIIGAPPVDTDTTELSTEPRLFDTTTEYALISAGRTVAIVYVALVAPEIDAPPFFH